MNNTALNPHLRETNVSSWASSNPDYDFWDNANVATDLNGIKQIREKIIELKQKKNELKGVLIELRNELDLITEIDFNVALGAMVGK